MVEEGAKGLAIERYVKRDQRPNNGRSFNNLYVKQFPRADFNSEDLLVSVSFFIIC